MDEIKSPKDKIMLWLGIFTILFISIYNFLPIYFKWYNSDHAIHVLMTKDFTLPRDYYYWGQNRIGSLLPMVSYWIMNLFSLTPIWAVSLVHFLFLFIPTYLLSKLIQNIWLKLTLFTLVFLPFNEYNALVYVGHPYSQQFFCCAIMFLSFYHAKLLLEKGNFEENSNKNILYFYLLLVNANIFNALGVWVSEFNALFVLIPILFFIPKYKVYFKNLGKKHLIITIVLQLILIVLSYLFYSYVKSKGIKDDEYSSFFINHIQSVIKQFWFMAYKFLSILDFSEINYFYSHTIYFEIFIIARGIFYFKDLIIIDEKIKFAKSLLITSLVAFVFLFFSKWNFRGEFCPRYYIPIYLSLAIAMILYYDKLPKYKFINEIIFSTIFFHCVWFTYNSTTKQSTEIPSKLYTDFNELPEGTLIADYWDTYKIASYYSQLIPLTYDDQISRSSHYLEKALKKDNFYFLKSERSQSYIKGDTITQYGIKFINSHITYKFKACEVLVYTKLNN